MVAPAPFALFGLPAVYALDKQALEAIYRQLSQKLHPDRQPVDASRQQVLLQAAALNEAYEVLRDDEKRAACLLAWYGKAVREGEATPADPSVWNNVLEWQEAWQDAAGDVPAVRQVYAAVDTEIKQLLQQRTHAFAAVEQGDVAKLDMVVRIVQNLRYYHRLAAQLQASLEEEIP